MWRTTESATASRMSPPPRCSDSAANRAWPPGRSSVSWCRDRRCPRTMRWSSTISCLSETEVSDAQRSQHTGERGLHIRRLDAHEHRLVHRAQIQRFVIGQAEFTFLLGGFYDVAHESTVA